MVEAIAVGVLPNSMAAYINPVVTTKKKIQAIKKIHEGIAFFNEDFSIQEQIDKLTPFSRQMEDFRMTDGCERIKGK